MIDEISPIRPVLRGENNHLMREVESGYHNKEFLQLSVDQYRQRPFDYSAQSINRIDGDLSNKQEKQGGATDFVKK